MTTTQFPSGNQPASNPDEPTQILFGTDGWRAKVADDFTFQNVRRCADAVASYVVGRGEQSKGVVIAYDRRFASEHFAAAVGEVMLAHDIHVALAAGAVPTQMSSFEVVQRGAAAGIVITASHNPWTDNGFKIKSPSGAAGAMPPGMNRSEGRFLLAPGAAVVCDSQVDFLDNIGSLIHQHLPYRKAFNLHPQDLGG